MAEEFEKGGDQNKEKALSIIESEAAKRVAEFVEEYSERYKKAVVDQHEIGTEETLEEFKDVLDEMCKDVVLMAKEILRQSEGLMEEEEAKKEIEKKMQEKLDQSIPGFWAVFQAK